MKEKGKFNYLIEPALKKIDDFISEKKADVNLELDKILSYINGTLIASFLVIFSIVDFGKSQEYFILKLVLVSSLLLFIISLLTLIRYISRYSKRFKYFGEHLKKIMKPNLEDVLRKTEDFRDQFIMPTILYKAIESKSSGKNFELIKEEAIEKVGEVMKNSVFTEIVIENLFYKSMDSLKTQTFLLPENFPRLNKYLDLFSEKFRYIAFILGMTLFLAAFILFVWLD